jgi:hypothetical protein
MRKLFPTWNKCLNDAFKLTFGIRYWSKLLPLVNWNNLHRFFREWCEDMRNPHNFVQFMIDEDHVPEKLTIQLDSMRDGHHLSLIGFTVLLCTFISFYTSLQDDPDFPSPERLRKKTQEVAILTQLGYSDHNMWVVELHDKRPWGHRSEQRLDRLLSTLTILTLTV